MTTEELIEKIKRVLNDPEGLTREQLETLSSEYASRSRRLNAKLDRAVACIRAGQFCEADRIEREGKIIDELQTLSFEEDSTWRDVCRGANCDATAQPSFDAAMELQLFVLKFDEVRDVFQEYRRLSVAVAPAKERLAPLYRLRVKFPNAQTISRTIEALEDEFVADVTERLRKIDPQNPPADFFEEALAELENPARIKPAPEPLIQELRVRVNDARNRSAVAATRRFLNDWARAKIEYDERKTPENENKTLDYYARYKSGGYAATIGSLNDDERAVVDLLCGEARTLERKRAASAELKRKTNELARAARTARDADSLSNLMAAAELTAENAESRVDKSVAEAVEKRIETLQLQKSRRATMIVGTAAALILLFSAAILFSIHRAQFEKEVNQAAKEINDKLDEFVADNLDSSLEDARKRVDDYAKRKPNYNEVQTYLEAVERVKKISKAEENRAFEFAEGAADVEKFLNAGFPRDPGFLNGKARTIAEKTRCRELSGLYVEVLAAYNDERDEKNEELLDALQKEWTDFQTLAPAKRRAALADMKRKIALYKEPVSGERQNDYFVERLNALQEQIDATSEREKQERKNNAILDDLRNQIGSISKYNEKLETMRNALDEADSKLAELAAGDVENVSRANVWNNYIADASFPLKWTKNAPSFEKIAGKADAAKDALSFAPEYEELTTRIKTWRAFAESGGFDAMRTALENALEPYSTPLYLRRDPDSGERVYLTSKPESPDAENVERETGEEQKKKFDLSKLSDEDFKEIKEALQCSLYREVKQKNLDDPRELVDEIVSLLRRVGDASEETLDPLLKAILLNDLLKSCRNCPGFDVVNERFDDACENSTLDFKTNFYRNADAKAQRENAIKLLDDFGSVGAKLDEAISEFAEASAPIKGRYEWIGHVDAVGDKATVAFGSERPENGRSLWIARGTETAVECGTVVNGEAELNARRNWGQYRWTPVYARTEEEPSETNDDE